MQHDFLKMGGRGDQKPVGTFPKIQPFWSGHPSLNLISSIQYVSIWHVALFFADETNDLCDSRFCGPLHKILKMGVQVFGFGLNLVFVPSENVSLSRMQDGKDHQSQ